MIDRRRIRRRRDESAPIRAEHVAHFLQQWQRLLEVLDDLAHADEVIALRRRQLLDIREKITDALVRAQSLGELDRGLTDIDQVEARPGIQQVDGCGDVPRMSAPDFHVAAYALAMLRQPIGEETVTHVLLVPEDLRQHQPEHVVLHDARIRIDAVPHFLERTAGVGAGTQEVHPVLQHAVAQLQVAVYAVTQIAPAGAQKDLECGDQPLGARVEDSVAGGELPLELVGVGFIQLADAGERGVEKIGHGLGKYCINPRGAGRGGDGRRFTTCVRSGGQTGSGSH